MKKSLIWVLAIIVVIILLGLIFFSSSQEKKESKLTQPIKIGAVLSLTGAAASQGDYALKAINLAKDEINQKGGVDGRLVEVVVEDDQTDPKESVNAFNKLINVDRVDGVIGSLWDFTTQPLIPLALTSSTTLISPTNFRIAGNFDLNSQSFVMLTDLSKVIGSLKDYLSKSSIKKLGVLRFQSSFGSKIAKTLDLTMKSLGRGGAVDEIYTNMGSGDFRTQILKLKQAKVDAVFLDMLDSDTLSFIKESTELDYHPTIITHTLVLDALKNSKVDKKLLEDVVVVNWEINSGKFTELFKAKYDIDPAKSAVKSYEALYILSQAISASPDRGSVAQYLEQNVFNPLGEELKFTPEHVVESTPVEVQVIKGGELVKI